MLLVEDNPVNLMVAQRLVGMLGLHCETADNGEKALERMHAGNLDVVLMDCQMPVKDGYTASREWRQHEGSNGLPRLPIIAMTANAMAGDRQKCLDAGMDDYLSKPVDRRLLEATIARWLQQRPQAVRRSAAARGAGDQRPQHRAPTARAGTHGAGAAPRAPPRRCSRRARPLATRQSAPDRAIPAARAGTHAGAWPRASRRPARSAPRQPRLRPDAARPNPTAPKSAADAPLPPPVLASDVVDELRAVMGNEYLSLVRLFLEDAPKHVASPGSRRHRQQHGGAWWARPTP